MPIAHHYYCGGLGFVIAGICIRRNPHGRVVVQKQQPPSPSSIGEFVLDGFRMCPILFVLSCVYRNTTVGSPLGERLYFFWKNIRFASQKLNSRFLFFSKKIIKMTLNSLEVTKCCRNQFILFLFYVFRNL